VKVRRLEPGEWDLLHGVDDGFSPDPKASIAVCAFNESGDIIGRIFLVAPVHVEGIFIDRQWRNTGLMKKLVERIEDEASKEGLKKVLAFAKDDEMADYIQRLGYDATPVRLYVKELA
jgi:N-acetylglutamate synthase-like GNAT family acetyltransferase